MTSVFRDFATSGGARTPHPSQGSGNGPAGPGSGSGPATPGSGGSPAGPLILSGGLDDTDEELPLINLNMLHANDAPAMFRDELIDQTMAVLISHNKANALLVGPAGVGKTRISSDIARRLANDDPSLPDQLKGYTLYELPMGLLTAGTALVGSLEEKLQQVLDFATDPANQAILFIDEIHTITGENAGNQYQRIAQLLKPELARGNIKVIGATTTQESRGFDADPALKRRFSRLFVDELSREQTVEVLHNAREGYLAHYQHAISLSDENLQYIVTYADDYNSVSNHRPDNALTLMDKAMADLTLRTQRIINEKLMPVGTVSPLTSNHIRQVAERMMTGTDAISHINFHALEEDLSHILGQDHIIAPLVKALRRDQSGIFPRQRPLSWLFAGPSGVGKTEVARIISRNLLGTEPIILNCAEFHHGSSITRIIGSPPSYVGSTSNKELPFDILETNPRQVILLDELEKADASVHHLFLSALDSGEMQMASGKTIDFSKAIVIATTNAARAVLSSSGFGFGGQDASTLAADSPQVQEKLRAALGATFPLEFLGRFSWLVAFNPICQEIYSRIIEDVYAGLKQELEQTRPHMIDRLAETIDPDDLYEMVTTSYQKNYGARPARRCVQRYIEDVLDPI